MSECCNSVRSSHWRCSIKKAVIKNFAVFTRTRQCRSLFFNNIAGLEEENWIQILYKQLYKTEKIKTSQIFLEALKCTSNIFWSYLLVHFSRLRDWWWRKGLEQTAFTKFNALVSHLTLPWQRSLSYRNQSIERVRYWNGW